MGSIGSKYPRSPFALSRFLSHRLRELSQKDIDPEKSKEAYPKDEVRWLKIAALSFLTCTGILIMMYLYIISLLEAWVPVGFILFDA